MGPVDFIVIGIVVLVVGVSAFYVIRAKKKGARCIGCPDGCGCSSKCSGGCTSCGGCYGVENDGAHENIQKKD